MPVPQFDVLRDAGKLLSEKGRQDMVAEAASAAAKILYVAFHTCQCETHIDCTFEFAPGQKFRIKFEKIDTLV